MRNAVITLLSVLAVGLACTRHMPAARDKAEVELEPITVTAAEKRAPAIDARLRQRGMAVADAVGASYALPGRYNPNFNTEAYDHIVENVFLGVAANPLSTFSIDVDRASYSNVRRFINQGQRPPKGRRAHRGADQLLHLRLPGARRRTPLLRHHRGDRCALELAAQAGPHRHSGSASRHARPAAQQSRLLARRLRFDAVGGQAAAVEVVVPHAGERAAAAGPGRHRRLRRRRGPGAAFDARRREGRDPRRYRSA